LVHWLGSTAPIEPVRPIEPTRPSA
jgi:hypothetical protein